MKQALVQGRTLQPNPYIVQMEKISGSLKQLSTMFMKEGGSTEEELEKLVDVIKAKIGQEICSSCAYQEGCETKLVSKVQEMVEELIKELDEYGVELSVAKRRELQGKCQMFTKMKELVEMELEGYKQNDIWERKLLQTKKSSLVALHAYAEAIEEITHELDASIFRDDRSEKRIGQALRKMGVRPLKITLMVSNEGRYEIQISAKAKRGVCITTQEIAQCLSGIVGMYMVQEQTEPFKLQEEYSTMIFRERLKYNALYGMAKRKKKDSPISGDNFLVIDMPGGKKGILLSDGMGSGEKAFQESKRVIELAEELLATGVSPELIVEMINAALVTGTEEVEFATLDLCVVDLYQGLATMIKAGSVASYIKSKTKVRSYEAASLPLGVLSGSELDIYQTMLGDEAYIIMLTDGVLELIPMDLRECYVETFLQCLKTSNPKEIANELLDGLLRLQGDEIRDDMMVLVLGVWKY